MYVCMYVCEDTYSALSDTENLPKQKRGGT
jgi:hypothetical protein